jgi:predicted DNA-binding ribbon-helix-helix protein
VSPRGPFSFEEAIWRELDQMRQTADRAAISLEKALGRLDERDEERDKDVSDLRIQVTMLRSECKRNMKRDAGLVSVPTIAVTAVVGLLNWLTQPPPAPPPPTPAASVQRAPSPTGG